MEKRFDAAHELGHLLMHVDFVAGDDALEKPDGRFGQRAPPPRVVRRQLSLTTAEVASVHQRSRFDAPLLVQLEVEPLQRLNRSWTDFTRAVPLRQLSPLRGGVQDREDPVQHRSVVAPGGADG